MELESELCGEMNKTHIKTGGDTEFLVSKAGIAELVGSKLDNAQYVSLMLVKNSERPDGKVAIGHLMAPSGKRFRISINGLPTITTHKGESVYSHEKLAAFITSDRENELNFDSLAYFEVEGETSDRKTYIGIFYSIADAKLRLKEEAERGEV